MPITRVETRIYLRTLRLARHTGGMMTRLTMRSLLISYLGFLLWNAIVVDGYSQSPKTYGQGARDDMVDWSQHPCRRKCSNDGPSLTCRYGLTVERYSTMSKACYDCPQNITDCFRPHCLPADGKEKVVVVANRQLPGINIEVCKGDKVIVDVTNALPTETTTIHWHGLHMRNSPWMDGVPYITQCPILPGQSFRYQFEAHMAGSFMWHSHSGEQRADGLFGGLIIRSPPHENLHASLYDEDNHVVLVNEWTTTSGGESYVFEQQNGRNPDLRDILVNGLGSEVNITLGNGNDRMDTPIATFKVEQGKRYRFRLLNIGAQNCPIDVSIDNHPLLVIATDGADIEPVEVDTIRVLSGERYDFILVANQKVDDYWIRFNGELFCTHVKSQVAVLKYNNALNSKPTSMPSAIAPYMDGPRLLNPFDEGTETPGAISVTSLKSLAPDDITLTKDPDHRIYIAYDFYGIDTIDYHRKNLYGFNQVKEKERKRTMQLNNISFKMPAKPLFTQHEQIEPGQLCNDTTAANCTLEQCLCTLTYNVRLNTVVEVVIIDKGVVHMSHPMHLHGYYYRVVAMEKVNSTFTAEQFKQMDEEGKIHRNLKAAPLKDTVTVPGGGYTIIRFFANNPGYWFFHCHFDSHATSGMAMLFKVGEHKDFPKAPKDFPKC